jgi:hypothetical protein
MKISSFIHLHADSIMSFFFGWIIVHVYYIADILMRKIGSDLWYVSICAIFVSKAWSWCSGNDYLLVSIHVLLTELWHSHLFLEPSPNLKFVICNWSHSSAWIMSFEVSFPFETQGNYPDTIILALKLSLPYWSH